MELIEKYFPNLTDDQHDRFRALDPVYRHWNSQINVISRKDIDALYERHVLHSLALAKFVQWRSGSTILDVGTGGGFPGIPLAIMFPESHFTLIDSIAKKIKVVTEVSRELQLSNLEARAVRAEQVTERFDFIVTRAVTRVKPFLQWTRHNLSGDHKNLLPNGILALKGGDLTEELNEIKRPVETYDISDYFEEAFFATKKIVYIPMDAPNK